MQGCGERMPAVRSLFFAPLSFREKKAGRLPRPKRSARMQGCGERMPAVRSLFFARFLFAKRKRECCRISAIKLQLGLALHESGWLTGE
jgi:hypothetical protein